MTALPILVIDDELAILKIFERLIGSSGLQCDLAESTSRGIDLINSKQYGLVFTDLEQKPSGLEVFSYNHKRGIETYIMSGAADEQLLEQVRSKVGDHFLQKPFLPSDIKRILDTYKASQS